MDKRKPNYQQKVCIWKHNTSWFDPAGKINSLFYFFLQRIKEPLDIAASIKALANSVHGDTIFGDLPPPRIGSRI